MLISLEASSSTGLVPVAEDTWGGVCPSNRIVASEDPTPASALTMLPLSGMVAEALARIFLIPGQRWHRGRASAGNVVYDDVPQRDLTVGDLDAHVRGACYIALAAGATNQATWLGWDVDTRDESSLIASAQAIEAETGLRVLTWDSGNKGYHQAICFLPTDFATAESLKRFLERRLEPLQRAADEAKRATGKGDFFVQRPGGRALSLPAGTHPVTGRSTDIVVPDGDRLRQATRAEVITLLGELYARRQMLPALPPERRAAGSIATGPWQAPPSFFFSYRPCMDHLCHIGVDRPMSRHPMTLAVIGAVKSNPAIPADARRLEVERIVRRNAGQLRDQGLTESDEDYAAIEAQRLYNSVVAPVSPSCFHLLHREVAFAVARGRPEMCLTCRFNEVKRRGPDLLNWNLQLHALGVFAHTRARRPGLGLTAGTVYQAMIVHCGHHLTGALHDGLETFTMTYPQLRRYTGIARDETLHRAMRALVDYGLVRRAVKPATIRRGNVFTLPVLDADTVAALLQRLWGEEGLLPEAVAIADEGQSARG